MTALSLDRLAMIDGRRAVFTILRHDRQGRAWRSMAGADARKKKGA